MATRCNSAWDRYYKTARWQRLRKLHLAQHPMCKFCLEHGIVRVANVVDHVTPHKGDWNAFVTGKLQSLCKPCPHKWAKRQVELRGYRCDIGLDGYPTPARRGREACSIREPEIAHGMHVEGVVHPAGYLRTHQALGDGEIERQHGTSLSRIVSACWRSLARAAASLVTAAWSISRS